jgi:serine/threonine protein kinase
VDRGETRARGDGYEVVSLLATGGMGQVWWARDTLLDRPVAVKVLRSEFTGEGPSTGKGKVRGTGRAR